MKGSVIKRGAKWSVVVDIGRDSNGKRIRRWHSGFRTKREAEAARVEILSRLQAGSYVAPNKVTVGEYLESWLTGRTTIAETTRSTYRMDVARVARLIGHRRLLELQHSDIVELYAQLSAQGLSPKSVRNVHGLVHRALRDAVRQQLVPRNVADGVEVPRAIRPEIKTWTALELRAFLSHVASHRLYAAWLLAVSTGMRRSELLGLRWESVDLESARLATVDTLVVVDGQPKLRLGETKTFGSRRSIALDAKTVEVLRSHRKRQLEERLAAGEAYTDLGLVFCNELGLPVKPAWFTRATKRFAIEAGVPPLGPHAAARHTWATLALEQGIHPKVVADRLGHSSVSTTLDRYSHVIEGMDREAAEVVAALIG